MKNEQVNDDDFLPRCTCGADRDAHIRQNAMLRLALLDVYDRERAQDETTCWVRSKYGPPMSLTAWVEKVLDEANLMEGNDDGNVTRRN